MCFVNVGVSMQMCGVRAIADVPMLAVIDYILFFARLLLVSRPFMKTCPKVINYLVAKHIDNLPSPLPQHMHCVGAKIAMRTIQAMFTTCECEATSLCLCCNSLMFIIGFNILYDPQVIY